MKKSIFTFGIILSMAATSFANTTINPTKKNNKVVTTTIKDVAPLSIAVAQSDVATVKKFLEFGADIEVKTALNGMTPLMYAARYNNARMIKLLLDNGADTNAKSKMGFTALEYAKLSNATDAIDLLK
tara:strand:+ start:72914 stop:73297 length:384 start_codon:yes stop_codon:yes gene_type:complete